MPLSVPSPLQLAKTGWSAYSTAKDAVTAVTKPVQWVKDKLVEVLAESVLAVFKATVGPALAHQAFDRLNLVEKTLPFQFEVPVPSAASAHLTGEELELAQAVVNEALAGPLELLGYRLGKVGVALDEQTHRLKVSLKVGILPAVPVGQAAVTTTTTNSAPASS